MLKKKVAKVALVLLCLVTLVMPHASVVLAGTLDNETSAKLAIRTAHAGGEATGFDESVDLSFYDTTPYVYKVGSGDEYKTVFKIIHEGDENFSNDIYCVDAIKSFPGGEGMDYEDVADFKDPSDLNVKALHMGEAEKWNENYLAVNWLINNFYLKNQAPEQKKAFIDQVYSGYMEADSHYPEKEVIWTLLTDDDIDVVQQRAIWYFTNNDDSDYTTEDLAIDLVNNLTGVEDDFVTVTSTSASVDGMRRFRLVQDLYDYLINGAKAAAASGEIGASNTFPMLDKTRATITDNNEYFIMGPIKMTSGTADPSRYTIKLVDQTGTEINRSEYKLLINGESDFTTKNINEIFDVDYYIYLPKTNKTITEVKLVYSHETDDRIARLWENSEVTETGERVYQPVVLIKCGTTEENLPFEIDRKTADLAVRKYIVTVNGKRVNSAPVVDLSGLKNGTSQTAEYKQAKTPVEVSTGDTVVYEIRVYNEGDVKSNGVVLIDSLPTGLELAQNSTINDTYGWEEVRVGTNSKAYKTNYLENTEIEAYDPESNEGLSSVYVQIECRVATEASASATLTNVAEIIVSKFEEDYTDRDSTPANNDYTQNDLDSSNYTGNNSNKSDLTDSDYFYKGREDDDDFAKVVVKGKAFDLSIKKFISKVNMVSPATNREPVVDVTPLKNGETDATYKTVKSSLNVEQGDIILYTIRVYNEGELAGYAEEVVDYLPEGLGFLVNYTTNVDNYWKLPEDATTVKLNTIPNATSHLSADDFSNGVRSLDDVEVVVGKATFTSTKLASSTTDENNLIKAFDQSTDKLDYKDIYMACVVLADKAENNNFRNIVEITKDSDKDRHEVTDRDSTPDSIKDPSTYVPGSKSNEDDDDYENLTTDPFVQKFDLSLKKFITKVNGSTISGRAPVFVKGSNGTLRVDSADVKPLQVENTDVITYTIRVYNEGNTAGYAAEVSDTIPEGLIYLKDNDTNKKYGWKMCDKNGNETTDVASAVTVKTDYLSKAKSQSRNDDALLDAYDPDQASKFDYRDIEIVFQVNENVVKDSSRKVINTAEITDDTDADGNPVTDIDSTPRNNKSGEDDIDTEELYVKYFDLELVKDLTKIIVTEDGTTREISVSSKDGLQKVEIHRKKVNTTQVKFVYTITVKNTGEIEGYATEIKDYIPEGLSFIAEENKQWSQSSDRVITTNALASKLLKPGESASVQVVLKWVNGESNMNLKTNIAEISAAKNDSNTRDIDSTPDNKIVAEDDYDTADVFLAISTGTSETYFTLVFVILTMLSTGIMMIKKYVL